jgi:AmmeMemoRadiSam system protein B
MAPDLRPAPFAGSWYEGEPKILEREVDAYLDAAQLPPLEGEVIAVIAPHAGHRYSGLVAVLSPFHNYHHAALLTSSHEGYATPLGRIPIDGEAMEQLEKRLADAGGPALTRLSKDPEHSLEIELPFLIRALSSEWQLMPIMVRTQDAPTCRVLGKALADVLRERKALLVASTDLSHYHEQQMALSLDRAMLAQIEAFDPETLFDLERSGRGSACGLGAMAAVMWAARDLGADKVEILRHATSGDVTGDYSAVVGYGAAAIMKTH